MNTTFYIFNSRVYTTLSAAQQAAEKDNLPMAHADTLRVIALSDADNQALNQTIADLLALAQN